MKLFLILNYCFFFSSVLGNNPTSVQVILKNKSLKEVEVGWEDPGGGEVAYTWTIEKDGVLSLTSMESHSFLIRGVSNNETTSRLIVTEDEMQTYVINTDLLVEGEASELIRQVETDAWRGPNLNVNERMVLFVNEFEEDMMILEGEIIIKKHSSQFIIAAVGQKIKISDPGGEVLSYKIASTYQQTVFLRLLNKEIDSIKNHKFMNLLLLKKDLRQIIQSELSYLFAGCLNTNDYSIVLKCISHVVSEHLYSYTKINENQIQIQNAVAHTWENYTCSDFTLPTTPPLFTSSWTYPKKNKTYPVQVLHSLPSSKIHLIENFVTEEECLAVEEAAQGNLRAAATEGDVPGEPSKYRKALQSGVDIPWHLEARSDPIATMARRIVTYTNHVTNFNLDIFGQEPLMSIQYKGSNDLNDPFPDQYLPHCDGDCTGIKHKKTGRVATAVAYCTIPQLGGATNFLHTGLHIVPKLYSLLFFSYIDQDTQIMDKSLTTHSGCPVIQGEKKLITQWLRYGVDLDHTWKQFSPTGNKMDTAYAENEQLIRYGMSLSDDTCLQLSSEEEEKYEWLWDKSLSQFSSEMCSKY